MSTLQIAFPLDRPITPGPSRFCIPATDSQASWNDFVDSYRAAKRIAVVCGVSTAASIPDFRGSSGLFSVQSCINAKGKGREPIKDLFHVKSLLSPTLLAAHQALITELASLAFAAEPTSFHLWLKRLDEEKRLLRVYTQNIDGLEEKAGLRYGTPPRPAARCKRTKPSSTTTSAAHSAIKGQEQLGPCSTILTPRVIPVHGTISTLHCTICHLSTPLLPYLPLPPTPIPCPACHLNSSIRNALSERSRRIGHLRPSIVLYGEEHHQGDLIAYALERDIKGTGGKMKEGKVDWVLVAGTSLAIPGVKRMVKELAKAVRGGSRGKGRGKCARGTETEMKVVLVNDEAPKNPAEWSGVFDLWIQGDIQEVIRALEGSTRDESSRFTKAAPEVERRASKGDTVPSTPQRQRRQAHLPATPVSGPVSSRNIASPKKITPKRKRGVQLVNGLPTPRATPPSPSRATKRRGEDNFDTPSKKTHFSNGLEVAERYPTPPLDFGPASERAR